MRTLLGLIVVLCLVHSGLCCGKGKKKPGGKTGDQGPVLPRKLGDGVTTAPYAAGPDQPGDCSALSCNLDDKDSCCWTNNQPPADQLNWVKGGGQIDSAKLQENFGTSTAPQGNFFLTASDVAGTQEQTAHLYSCPIACSDGDITVKAKHWATNATKIQVCSETDPAGPPQNCQDLPPSNGNEDSVTIPKGENQRVVIQAVGFQDPTGTVAMVDDIQVECNPCAGSTPPPGTDAATPGATPAPAAPAPCKEITCDFESGSPCSYTPASGGGNAAENWGVHDAPYQNKLTGVPKPSSNGQKFASTYTKKKGEKSSLETNANFESEYVVRYQYYKATDGLSFKGCCNDESSCPKDTGTSVQTADYKAWKTESITCPAGTKKVVFICENMDGNSEGACAIDNIQLLQPSGGSPSDASQSAC